MLRKRSTEERLADLETEVREIKADRRYWTDFFQEAKAERAEIKKNMATKADLSGLYDRIRKLLSKESLGPALPSSHKACLQVITASSTLPAYP